MTQDDGGRYAVRFSGEITRDATRALRGTGEFSGFEAVAFSAPRGD
jgi:hypothetical protein